jgi:hypothetical protein
MFTVSEILCPVSVIYVTYPGVVVPRKYSTTASGVLLDPAFILASCHAPVSRRGSPGAVTPCRESSGGSPPPSL